MLTDEEQRFIREAAEYLEKPSLLMRAAATLGDPIEKLQKRLPDAANRLVTHTTRKALESALGAAIKSIPTEAPTPEADFKKAEKKAKRTGRLHTVSTAMTGAVGGALGFAALPIELPLSTTLMLRAIARIAEEYGADLASAETRLECLYIFTLGSSESAADDAAETGYYASRLAFAQLLREATVYLAGRSAGEAAKALSMGSAPVLVRLIAAIAARFELTVTEKLLAGAVPLIGAAGSASLNAAFTAHFSKAARFHFGLRRLEALHGAQEVQEQFKSYKLRR